jgi:hypothetical protein
MAKVSFQTAESARAATAASERAREDVAQVLQALAESGTAAKLASDTGVSEATVSRWKLERMEESVTNFAHLGFRLVRIEDKVLDPKAYDFLVSSVIKAMQVAPGIILGVRA